MKTEQKTFTKDEYETHGERMFDYGKCTAYRDLLKTDIVWCVSMSDKNWNLDTILFGDGNLKNIPLVNKILTHEKDSQGNYIPEYIIITAKDAKVKEIWLAAERSYKIAKEEFEDWHSFLEIIEFKNNKIYSFFGS